MAINFRNKYLVITVRILLGAMFIFSGVGGLLAGQSMEGVPAAMVANQQALYTMGIFQMIKITEIIAGLMLLTGFLPALGAIAVVPVCVGILIVNGRTAPEYLPMGIAVSLATAFLGYAYWDKYKVLFKR